MQKLSQSEESSVESDMEIKGCELVVTNIKISVKLPLPVCLQSVEKRCKQLSQSRIIYCNRKKENILTIRYNNFTYVLFKVQMIQKTKIQPDVIFSIDILPNTRIKTVLDIVWLVFI